MFFSFAEQSGDEVNTQPTKAVTLVDTHNFIGGELFGIWSWYLERLLHTVYQKMLQPSVKTSAVAIIPASLPFLGLRLPSEMNVKGQPLSPDYWDHMRVTESGIYGVGHVSFTLQLSRIPLQRPGLSWLAGVSNDLRSEVVSQRKHTALAQLQADLTSPRTARFGKRFRCLLKTDDVMRFNYILLTAPLCPL